MTDQNMAAALVAIAEAAARLELARECLTRIAETPAPVAPTTPTEEPLPLSAALGVPTHMVIDVYRFLEREGFLTSGKYHKLTEAGIVMGLGINRHKAHPLFYPTIKATIPRTVLLAGLDVYLSEQLDPI